MTMLEKLTQVLGDGEWHSTVELVERVGYRFSATLHRAVKAGVAGREAAIRCPDV